ncbi:MAG: hypothetical protein ACFFCM_19190 [Promethearchaeota archaeon]
MTKKYYDNKLSANALQWNQLKDKRKLGNVAKKLYDFGFTAKQVLEMDKNGKYLMTNQQVKKNFNLGGRGYSSAIGFRKNVKQCIGTLERKKGVRVEVLPKFVSFTQNVFTKRTNQLLTQFSKTISLNVFFDIAKEFQKRDSLTEKQSYDKVRQVYDEYNLKKNKMNQKDLAILQLFY